MAKLSKGMLGLLGEIASLLNGAIASGLKLINNLVSSGFKMAFQFNESAMAFSRQAGLTAKQAQAYTEVLSTRAKELGEKYGIAAEEVTKLEKNLAKATGRVMMLSNAQADMQIAINRTVGEETANEFSQMMMRTMGAQIKTVQGAVSKAYATAAKNGLDAAGMAAKVAQNLSMANRLTFRNGVDGLTKMVALSEKFGFNVQTIESAANSFMDLQDSIENAAKLTMLGGAAGALGGNPLDMTYEANADPEAFAERLTKMAAGYAQFDAKTGIAKINYMSRDMLKGMADAMHISLDEMVTMAKKQSEVTYKNNNFGRDLDRLSMDENGRIDQNRRNFLLNRTQIEEGRMKMYSSKTGKYEDMSYFEDPNKGKAEFEEMMRFSGLSDEEIIREQAEAVVSIKDRLEGYFTSIQGLFAEKIEPFIPKIQEFLGDIYRIVVPYFGQIADNVKKLIGTLFTPENLRLVKDGIVSIVKGVTTVAKWLTSNWKTLLIAAAISPILSVLTWGFNMLAMFRGGGGSGGSGGPGVGAGGVGMWSDFANTTKGNYQAARTYGTGRFASANSAFRSTSVGRGIIRGGGILGAIAAGIGTYSAISDYNAREKEIRENDALSAIEKQHEMKRAANERNKNIGGAVGTGVGIGLGTWLGGIVGTMIAPGVGTAIGAAAGSAIGGWLGGEGGKALVDAVQGEPELHHDSVSIAGDGGTGRGARGKNTPLKSNEVRAILEKGEVVVSLETVNRIYERMQALQESVQALPVGQKEYIYTNASQTSQNVGNNKITVSDINVRFSGSVKLEGNNGASRDYDINDLIENREFIRRLFSKPEVVQAILSALNTNVHGKDQNSYAKFLGTTPPGYEGKMMNYATI